MLHLLDKNIKSNFVDIGTGMYPFIILIGVFKSSFLKGWSD